jgi:trigger factor
MKVERKDLDALTAELTLVVEKTDYLPEYEKQLKEYQQKAQLKGFRKGKTPLSIIKKMYGAATMQESVSKILGEKINDLISGDEFNIIGEPLFLDEGNVPEIDHTMPDDYSYRFEVGLEPEFELKGAGEEDSYVKRFVEISDEMIDEEMKVAQERLGQQKEVDGPIEAGDIVYLKINEKENGEIKEGGLSSEFSVSWDKIYEKYQKQLEKAKLGDHLEINVFELEEGLDRDNVIKYFLKINSDTDEAREVPENELYDAEITKITRLELAEMDQDFFDKYFGKDQVSNIEEAREKIREFLSSHFDNESTNLLNREIMEKLVELNVFDLPKDFLKKWITREQELEDDQFEAFLQEMKWRIIKKKLVKKHDIKVEEKEILEHFVQMIRNYSPYIDEASLKNTVFSLMKNREQVNNAVEAVSSTKLFDALREIVKIEESTISKDDFIERVQEINKRSQ